ncbi:hypothetical protein X801_02593 [Opisthorchis viverrini]|uniref:Uncharacterized protein n=1 Tax=Opisthorchis viverrini TaxID=6198 RepID=A0A1S8X4E3_OPIVI|nr:hypothetical protein X801_02593 [Opisthorchis viverrini]
MEFEDYEYTPFEEKRKKMESQRVNGFGEVTQHKTTTVVEELLHPSDDTIFTVVKWLREAHVTLIRNKDYHSLSNMGLEKTISLGNNWYADVFYPTVNTSTYVLAFVVSQFAPLSSKDSRGRNVYETEEI